MRIFVVAVGSAVSLWLTSSASAQTSTAAACERLGSLALPHATITFAGHRDAGAFVPAAPGMESTAKPLEASQPFCRVAATLQPSPDSDIRIEVLLPAGNWNGKFQAVGNGAFNGSIAYSAMLTALNRGYATSSTDTGHVGGGAAWALGHPEKVVDFGSRAIHEMTVAAKAIVAAYYEAPPRYSYWNGCSAGGRQGMKAAQRFPEDFDGIIAGAPGLDWTSRASQAVRVAQTLETNEAARLTPAKRQLLHSAVLRACDALDGVTDGILGDPRQCTFDPGVLECKGADSDSCLTSAQVATAKLIYSSAVNAKTKREITGLQRGSELGWSDLGWTASARATGLEQFRYLVFKQPDWTISGFNAETDIARAEETDNDTINALDPNLKPFIDRGGKLIQYHGWSDPQISPGNSVTYYERVIQKLGGLANVQRGHRLFMAPGMGHCGGGEGPNTFDMLAALEQWVEQGRAPDSIVASQSLEGVVHRTRPLCPYPQVAVYRGSGSTDDAASFVCRMP